MSDAVLALDVGGTHLRGAIVAGGRVVDRADAATAAGLRDGLERIVARLLPGSAAGAAGIGVPEYVRDGVVTSAEVVDWRPGTTDWAGRLVARAAGRAVPVVVEADVRCGAVAEHARLADPAATSLLYVSWGTGVSSTLVLPGGLAWAGARGEALAIGEWRDDAGRRLEDVAAGRGVERAYAAATGDPVDGVELHRRATGGDAVAAGLVEAADRALGRAIGRLVDALDPHLVVVGGGIGAGRADRLTAHAALGRRPGAPPLLAAHHGPDAGLIGAALVAARATAR